MLFRVLGSMTVEGPRGDLLDLKGLRQRAVLAVLLVEAGRSVSLDRLVDLVWDGEPPRQATGTLQAYVSRLRRVLEPDRDGRDRPWETLQTAGSGYRLAVEPDSVDAIRFESLCRRAANLRSPAERDQALRLLESALGLWHGDPYSDFRYFSFSTSEASRLEELRWSAIEHRAELLLQRGDHRLLVSELDDQVRSAPYRERLRGLLMLALYRSGRQADALACYQEGRRALGEDLGLEPGPELRRLEGAIIRQDPELDSDGAELPAVAVTAGPPREPILSPTVPDVPARPAMFGREWELGLAERVIGRVRGAGGGLLLLTGEAGIGKTRLAEETARSAERQGLRAFWGHCPEMEGAPPFWPWVQVARQVNAGDGALPRALRLQHENGSEGAEGPAHQGAFTLYEEVRAWLEREAAGGPLILVLEDLHWADTASVRLLRHLAAGAGVAGVMVLATTREEHGSPALSELLAEAARSPITERVRLGHLSREAAGELVSALKGEAVTAQTLGLLYERSGGNPFFLTELVRLGSAGTGGVPEGVQAVISRRLAQLSGGGREMLRAAACLPGDIDLLLLADVIERPESELLDLADEALAMRLLKESPDRAGRLQFSHPLLKDAVNAGVATARRAHLHRRVAEAIEARAGAAAGGREGPAGVQDVAARLDDETVTALAHHYSEAAVSGAVRDAARWSREAAVRELAQGAPEDARDRMVRTLDLVRRHGIRDDPMVVDLLIVRARAQRHTGIDTGRAIVSEAMSMARRLDDAGRVVEAALVANTDTWGFTAATFGQADEEVVEQLWWALPKWGRDNPPGAVAGAYVLANELIFVDGPTPGAAGVEDPPGIDVTGPGRAEALSRRALGLARGIPDGRIVLMALQSRWLAIWGPETLQERQALVDEMQAMVSRGGLERSRPLILAWATALEAADRSRTDAAMKATFDLLAEKPLPALRAVAGWRRSLQAILDGHIDEAECLINAAYEENARFHPKEAFDAFSGHMGAMYWLTGRMSELEPVLVAALVEQPYLAPAFGPALALAQLAAGRREDARATLRALDLTDRPVAPAAMSRSGTTATMAVAAAELGDPDLVAAALRFLGPASSSPAITDHVGVFYMGARAAHRGRLYLAVGRADDAVTSLEEGLAVDSRMGAVPFVIKDQLDLARALAARDSPGDRPRAAALLASAARTAEAHGFVADAKRAADLAADITARA